MTAPSKPRLCIGVPVHNGERDLEPGIESPLAPTFSHFRLIVWDDSSTDGTEEIGCAGARWSSSNRPVSESRVA